MMTETIYNSQIFAIDVNVEKVFCELRLHRAASGSACQPTEPRACGRIRRGRRLRCECVGAQNSNKNKSQQLKHLKYVFVVDLLDPLQLKRRTITNGFQLSALPPFWPLQARRTRSAKRQTHFHFAICAITLRESRAGRMFALRRWFLSHDRRIINAFLGLKPRIMPKAGRFRQIGTLGIQQLLLASREKNSWNAHTCANESLSERDFSNDHCCQPGAAKRKNHTHAIPRCVSDVMPTRSRDFAACLTNISRPLFHFERVSPRVKTYFVSALEFKSCKCLYTILLFLLRHI